MRSSYSGVKKIIYNLYREQKPRWSQLKEMTSVKMQRGDNDPIECFSFPYEYSWDGWRDRQNGNAVIDKYGSDDYVPPVEISSRAQGDFRMKVAPDGTAVVTYEKVVSGSPTKRYIQVCSEGENVELEDGFTGSDGGLVISNDASVFAVGSVTGGVNTVKVFRRSGQNNWSQLGDSLRAIPDKNINISDGGSFITIVPHGASVQLPRIHKRQNDGSWDDLSGLPDFGSTPTDLAVAEVVGTSLVIYAKLGNGDLKSVDVSTFHKNLILDIPKNMSKTNISVSSFPYYNSTQRHVVTLMLNMTMDTVFVVKATL